MTVKDTVPDLLAAPKAAAKTTVVDDHVVATTDFGSDALAVVRPTDGEPKPGAVVRPTDGKPDVKDDPDAVVRPTG